MRNDLLIVDVRDEVELTGSLGHIHGVTHLPASELMRNGLAFLSADTPIVLVCGNGRSSATCATNLVREHGFKEVYHLVGGMVRWGAEERPIARARTWK